MKWFSKKIRCLVCNRKTSVDSCDEVQYSYVDENNEKQVGKAYVCKKCGNKMDKTSEDIYDAI